MRHQKRVLVGVIFAIDGQLDELLPEVQLVGDTDKRLEVADRAFRVLLCKEDLVLNQLLALTVLIESHDGDARLLAESDLNVDPLVEGQENGV